MRDINKAKKIYNSIKIPEHLSYVVNKAVLDEEKNKKFSFKYINYTFSTVACTFFTFICLINFNPSFATSVSEIPILSQVAKVFTVKEFTENDEYKLIDAKIPSLENTGNTELEKRINYEILYKINEILAEAEARAFDYKKAVIETGGNADDFNPIKIDIDYKVGFSTDKVVSFMILKSETLASAYTEMYFYNIDIETGKKLNLRDVLGNDYKEIIDKKIYEEIDKRCKEKDNIYWKKGEGGFSGIENEYQDFYINSEGKVVVVFEKYEIAPGYMGIQEFEIDKKIF